MKNTIQKAVLVLLGLVTFTSCVTEDDFSIPTIKPVLLIENFDEVDFNENLDYEGWINYAEAGSKLWIEREFNNDGYAQFSSYQSGDASNIGWLISPSIDLTSAENVVLNFESASNFVNNAGNKLEVLISNDFSGNEADITSATWTVLEAELADNTTNNYTYIPSGDISLSAFTGMAHIAFRVTGNGNDQTGLFQVDKIKVLTLN